MTADRLREASVVLRRRAEAASAGPWVENVLGSEGYDIRADNPASPRRRIRVARFGNEEWETDKANATYVATMGPTVALALADWLRMEYDHAQGRGSVCDSCVDQAQTVADAILGTRS